MAKVLFSFDFSFLYSSITNEFKRINRWVWYNDEQYSLSCNGLLANSICLSIDSNINTSIKYRYYCYFRIKLFDTYQNARRRVVSAMRYFQWGQWCKVNWFFTVRGVDTLRRKTKIFLFFLVFERKKTARFIHPINLFSIIIDNPGNLTELIKAYAKHVYTISFKPIYLLTKNGKNPPFLPDSNLCHAPSCNWLFTNGVYKIIILLFNSKRVHTDYNILHKRQTGGFWVNIAEPISLCIDRTCFVLGKTIHRPTLLNRIERDGAQEKNNSFRINIQMHISIFQWATCLANNRYKNTA